MAAQATTLSTKVCLTVPALLRAVIASLKLPDAAGVPETTAFPLPVVNFSPRGSFPDSVIVGVGDPFAVKANLNALPTFTVAFAALMIVGGLRTVRVKACLAVPVLLCAETVTLKLPGALGVPEKLALPLPLVNLSPCGSRPDQAIAGAGDPLAVSANLNGLPTVAVALAALVNAGTRHSVSEKL